MQQVIVKTVATVICFAAAARFAGELRPISRTAPPPAASPVASPPAAAAPAPTLAALTTPPRSGLDTYYIPANSFGQYTADVLVEGQPLRMLVDTGATWMALRNEDAAAIGVFPLPGDYKVQIHTANGTARAAAVKLRQVQIGSIELFDVDALVGEAGAMNVSLLGMTFLSRLSNVEIASGALILRR